MTGSRPWGVVEFVSRAANFGRVGDEVSCLRVAALADGMGTVAKENDRRMTDRVVIMEV